MEQNLNNSQKQVVALPPNRTIKVMAGAGTGKTRVIVERYLKFIFDDGIPPDRILALTFTKKAAAEMRERIFSRVAEHGDRRLYRLLYESLITNFHSFCHRVMRDHPAYFDAAADADVATEVDIRRVQGGLYRRFERGDIPGMPEDVVENRLTPARMSIFFDECVSIMEKARGTLLSPDELLDTFTAEDEEIYRNHVKTVCAIWKAYESEMGRRGLIDFSAMIALSVSALKHNASLRTAYKERFDVILVDEFQDTSEAQNELLSLLSDNDFSRVTVVGDDKQSIYRWRDANVENIRKFPGETVALDTNYRSTQTILALAHRFIALDAGFSDSKKPLESDRNITGHPVVLFHPSDEAGASPAEEAKALAEWIVSLTGGVVGAPPQKDKKNPSIGVGDVAILLRTLKDSSGLPHYERALRAYNIPYSVIGASASLEASVLRFFYHLLSLLVRPNAVESLVYLLENEPLSLSDRDLKQLFSAGRMAVRAAHPDSEDVPPVDVDVLLSSGVVGALENEEAQMRCCALKETVELLISKWTTQTFSSFVWDLLDAGGSVFHFVCQGADSRAATDILKRMKGVVEVLSERDETNLHAFVEYLGVMIDEGVQGVMGEPHLPPDRVKIMTIHQAKGLEFPAVALPGFKPDNSRRPGFFVSKSDGVFFKGKGKTYAGRAIEDSREALAWLESDDQEERCLVYVAMTRAKDRLFISSSHPRGVKGKKESFFADILACLEEPGIEFEEWRAVPDGDRAGGSALTSSGSREDAGVPLEEWCADRKRLEMDEAKGAPIIEPVITVDWRSLERFTMCPLMYRYYREVKVEQGDDAAAVDDVDRSNDLVEEGSPVTGVDYATFGTFMHRLLFEAISSRDPEYDVLTNNLAGRFGFNTKQRNAVIDKAGRLIDVFMGTSYGKSNQVEALEEPFHVRSGRLMFRGVMDRIDRTNTGYRIIDYKVSRSYKKTIENKGYHFQLQFYAWALGKIKKTANVIGEICVLSDEVRHHEVKTGEKTIGKIEEATRSLGAAVESGEFKPSPGASCAECPYNLVCAPAVDK